jgi:hypothetical protein
LQLLTARFISLLTVKMRNLNKIIFGTISVIATIGITSAASAETIRTKNFEIKIVRHCEEGNVSCDRVTYIGRDVNTGKSIRLNGRTMNADHSYTFLGYVFQNGEYTYEITRNNLLLVSRGDRVIIREQGTSIDD